MAVSITSLGHLSTTALAASTLGSMTASVSGFSIIHGFTSTLDTMLPSAWTSSQPQLVGLWSHRMSSFAPSISTFHGLNPLASGDHGRYPTCMYDLVKATEILPIIHARQPIFAIWFNAEDILLLLRQEPEIARLAGVYLKWLSIGLPAYAFNCISRYTSMSNSLAYMTTDLHRKDDIFNAKVVKICA